MLHEYFLRLSLKNINYIKFNKNRTSNIDTHTHTHTHIHIHKVLQFPFRIFLF